MFHFISSYYRLFAEHFNRVDLVLNLVIHHVDFTEASFANHTQKLKIGWLSTIIVTIINKLNRLIDVI